MSTAAVLYDFGEPVAVETVDLKPLRADEVIVIQGAAHRLTGRPCAAAGLRRAPIGGRHGRMRSTRWLSLAGAGAVVVLLSLPPAAHPQTALRKAGRGLAAMTTPFLEIPGNTYREAESGGAGGAFLGFAKGLGMIVPRVLVGVYEFVSAPAPAPSGFRPILEPEFPWGYFEGGAPRGRPR